MHNILIPLVKEIIWNNEYVINKWRTWFKLIPYIYIYIDKYKHSKEWKERK